jgi:hypothetical protein
MTMSETPEEHPRYGRIDEYAGGEIRTYHGIVNWWLRIVYAALAIWAVYYLVHDWGGLGPGLGGPR